VDVEDFAFDAELLRALRRFGRAPLCQGAAGHFPVADVTIGDGAEFHLVTRLGPEGGRTAGFVLGVIGVGAEDDNAERFGVLSDDGGREQQNQDGQQ